MPIILDGKKVAEKVYSRILLELSLLSVVPRLVIVLVGEDPASQSYVRSKTKRTEALGIRGETITLPAATTEEELISVIRKLNSDKDVNGILVQLPLPAQIDRHRILNELNPIKDVDGLHPLNVGRLVNGVAELIPCTPAGIIEILKFYSIPMAGANAVIIGRSEIVGKPMANLLLQNNATVTVCHSKTRDLISHTSKADLVIAALGNRQFIGADMVKEGATVVDVGIHRTETGLVGDVLFEEVSAKASAITPVPGGVGPMTIAMLMQNLMTATKLQ